MHIMRAPDQHAQGESIALLTTAPEHTLPKLLQSPKQFSILFLSLQMHIMLSPDQHDQGECIALLTTAPEHTLPKLIQSPKQFPFFSVASNAYHACT